MQTVVGRLTADAKITTLEDGRNVVNFTIAQNERFKTKGADNVKQITSYYNCAYWMGIGIAPYLKKGTLVEAAGRVGINAWQGADSHAKASLTLHVQYIQLHGKAGRPAEAADTTAEEANKEDLPF